MFSTTKEKERASEWERKRKKCKEKKTKKSREKKFKAVTSFTRTFISLFFTFVRSAHTENRVIIFSFKINFFSYVKNEMKYKQQKNPFYSLWIWVACPLKYLQLNLFKSEWNIMTCQLDKIKFFLILVFSSSYFHSLNSHTILFFLFHQHWYFASQTLKTYFSIGIP